MPKLAPVTQSGGSLSSQDGGAQELPGSYTTRPIQFQVGKTASVVLNPRMGTVGGKDALGKANGRQGK